MTFPLGCLKVNLLMRLFRLLQKALTTKGDCVHLQNKHELPQISDHMFPNFALPDNIGTEHEERRDASHLHGTSSLTRYDPCPCPVLPNLQLARRIEGVPRCRNDHHDSLLSASRDIWCQCDNLTMRSQRLELHNQLLVFVSCMFVYLMSLHQLHIFLG